MGSKTGIAWTDHTFNSHMGCQRISPACGGAKGVGGCYAEALVTGRMGYNATSADPRRRLTLWGPPSASTRVRTSAANWRNPPAWDAAAKRDGVRRRVFCASLADVFEDHPDLPAVRADLWPLVERCDGLDWQLLTKRPENIARMVPPAWLAPGGWPSHVWVGCTVEDQRRANERIPHLLQVPARVRFLSCEPLLEGVDIGRWLKPSMPVWGRGHDGRWWCNTCCNGDRCDNPKHYSRPHCPVCKGSGVVPYDGVNWVIVGGESGPGARPFALEWARGFVAQCREAGVPCFVKQMGDNAVVGGERVRFVAHAGQQPDEWPADLLVQEFPKGGAR